MKKTLALLAIAALVVCSCRHHIDPEPEPQPEPEPEIPVYTHTEDIENEGVRQFLESVDYSSDTDYTVSLVQEYAGTDKPLPAKLSWEGQGASLQMSSSDKFEKDLQTSTVSGSSIELYNLIPGVEYYYKALASDGTLLKLGCVTPVGPLRMIQGVAANVRDLGGWKAADGQHIAYGKVYRGARLDDIQKNPSVKGMVIDTLGIDVDLDLRGLPPGWQGGSGEKNPWVEGDPVEYCNIKLWNYMYPSSKQHAVPEIADGSSADQYQLAIRKIIGWLGDGKVVYFHCHGGADRTGTLAFLLEALLGVSESDLSKDFELTTYAGSVHKRDGSAGWFFAPMVKYIRAFAPGKSIGEQVEAWAKTRHSDSVDPLTADEIARLREYMLVKD